MTNQNKLIINHKKMYFIFPLMLVVLKNIPWLCTINIYTQKHLALVFNQRKVAVSSILFRVGPFWFDFFFEADPFRLKLLFNQRFR